MLVLTRKLGQSLVIDGNTVVRVLEIKGNQIRLGIEAPKEVSVLRSELSARQAEVKEQMALAIRCPR
jgi:carbon storage regulator